MNARAGTKWQMLITPYGVLRATRIQLHAFAAAAAVPSSLGTTSNGLYFGYLL